MRRNLLRGTFAVPASELTPEDWALFYTETLGAVGKCLTRLPGFRPLREELGLRLQVLQLSLGPGVSPRFDQGISWNTRLTRIGDDLVSPAEPVGLGVMLFKQLTLTDQGKLVLWQIHYLPGELPKFAGMKFTMLDGDKLVTLLTSKSPLITSRFPRTLFARLQELLLEDRTRLQRRRQKNLGARRKLENVAGRVQGL